MINIFITVFLINVIIVVFLTHFKPRNSYSIKNRNLRVGSNIFFVLVTSTNIPYFINIEVHIFIHMERPKTSLTG